MNLMDKVEKLLSEDIDIFDIFKKNDSGAIDDDFKDINRNELERVLTLSFDEQ